MMAMVSRGRLTGPQHCPRLRPLHFYLDPLYVVLSFSALQPLALQTSQTEQRVRGRDSGHFHCELGSSSVVALVIGLGAEEARRPASGVWHRRHLSQRRLR